MTGGQLRVLLDRIRWSQTQIAEELGVPPARVRKWSAGLEAVPEPVAVWCQAVAGDLEAARLRNPPPRVPSPGRVISSRAVNGDAKPAA
jgi:transcriptional regulator with XRE-family HTH domain